MRSPARKKTLMSRKRVRLLWAHAAALFSIPFLSCSSSAEEASKSLVEVQAAPPAEQQIRFMGYNLKNYLNMTRRVDGESVESAPKPEREIAGIVTMITKGKPDVVGLVEIGTNADVEDLQRRLKESGLDLPHMAIIRSFDEDRRLALISRFPVVKTDHQASLSYMLGEQRIPFKRGILDATIQVNDHYQLRTLGVHLKSKREVPNADQALMRRNEAHLLRKHAESIIGADPDTNLILFGDFNDTRNEVPIKAIQGKYGSPGYLKDIQAADDLGYKWTYCWAYADQYSRFDFLFVNQGLLPEVDRDKSFIVSDPVWFSASDHRPVVTTITAKER